MSRGANSSVEGLFRAIQSAALSVCHGYTQDAYESICKGLSKYMLTFAAKKGPIPYDIIAITTAKAALRASIELALSALSPGDHVSKRDELQLVNDVIDLVSARAAELRKRGNNGIDPVDKVDEALNSAFDEHGFYANPNGFNGGESESNRASTGGGGSGQSQDAGCFPDYLSPHYSGVNGKLR